VIVKTMLLVTSSFRTGLPEAGKILNPVSSKLILDAGSGSGTTMDLRLHSERNSGNRYNLLVSNGSVE